MKKNNQLVLLSGIIVLLATATIATVYNVQTVEGAVPPKNFGVVASSFAHSGTNPSNPANGNGVVGNSEDHSTDFGQAVSTEAKFLAHNPP